MMNVYIVVAWAQVTELSHPAVSPPPAPRVHTLRQHLRVDVVYTLADHALLSSPCSRCAAQLLISRSFRRSWQTNLDIRITHIIILHKISEYNYKSQCCTSPCVPLPSLSYGWSTMSQRKVSRWTDRRTQTQTGSPSPCAAHTASERYIDGCCKIFGPM